MIAPKPSHDTALDRVANALASEAARAELYRYATNVAEAMPPDSSSWYVVGAVVQVNAVTRHELTTLAAEAKKGGTILAGLRSLVQWLPRASIIAAGAAAIALVFAFAVIVPLWQNAYGAGWSASRDAGYQPVNLQVCQSLANVRHHLALGHRQPDLDAMQREMTARGCAF
jgi:hypothetical protein